MQSETLSQIEEDIRRLEVGIRQLKVQYDMFFAGGLKRQPVELRWQLEKIIKRYSEKPLRNYAHRFKFNALIGRFNSFNERWSKAVRSMEEGDHRHAGLLDAFAIRERLLARARVGGDGEDDQELRRLHRCYVEAAARHGGKEPPPYETFVRGVRAKTQKLRDQSGCAEIELRVVLRDDKVQLKARTRR